MRNKNETRNQGDRAIKLFNLISKSPGLSLSDIRRALDVTESTLRDMLKTFVSAGFIDQSWQPARSAYGKKNPDRRSNRLAFYITDRGKWFKETLIHLEENGIKIRTFDYKFLRRGEKPDGTALP